VRRGALCTVAAGPHAELFDVARPGFERFAAIHGKELIVAPTAVSGGRSPGWAKVTLIRELLDEFDELLWVDADAVIVDPSADPCRLLGPGRPMGMVVHRYRGLEVPNMGVVALRAGRFTRRFVDRLWSGEIPGHPWLDNAPALDLLGYDVNSPRRDTRRLTAASARVVELDPSWNSIPQCPATRPRIAHFPGLAHEQRLAAMRAAAA
jgi:hypothetical protein